MTRKAWTNVILLLALVVIFGVSFVLGGQRTDPEERFAGTDSAATSVIEESGHEPWFSPFFEPESGEVESGLFALQAAIGGGVLGFAVGALWARRRDEDSSGEGTQQPSGASPATPPSMD
ncbi:MAG: energy-coupling factor ABC transporter substrate-binding protein [Actinomycetales bacterium]|nr:MAG: energy-coupling factor ABC transporter substrate-binding protein [Actinomycetales bacterium]